MPHDDGSAAETTVRRATAQALVDGLLQSWLHGFDGAWKRWSLADDRTRARVDEVLDLFRPTVAPGAFPPELSRDVLRVQLLNVCGSRGRDPHQALERLLLSKPPTAEGGLRHARSPRAEPGDAESGWRNVQTALVTAPDWRLILGAWSLLTPEFRGMVRLLVPGTDPPPESVSEPEGVAWLDRASAARRPEDVELIRAYRGLSEAAAGGFADALLDQYARWRNGSIVPSTGCVQSINGVVSYRLAALAGFHGPLSEEARYRAAYFKLTYPFGILRSAETDEAEPESSESYLGPYFRDGWALELSEAAAELGSAPVLAGHGEVLTLRPGGERLLVLLELALTAPELAFLGLKGERLRVCDWEHARGEVCFTRVGPAGEVALYSAPRPYLGTPLPHQPLRPLVLGRRLESPLEGRGDYGGLGAGEHLGGTPNWEQHSEWPLSPVDGSPMTFLAQFPHPDGSTAYIFLDIPNRVAAVTHQCD